MRFAFTEIRYLDGFDQKQKEAVIDLIVLMMQADGIVKRSEQDQLDELLEYCPWYGKEDLTAYLDRQGFQAANAAKDPSATRAYVRSVRDRIGDPDQVQKVYLLCDQMANADQDVAESEMRVLQTIVEELKG